MQKPKDIAASYGMSGRTYRLIYSIFSIIGLFFLLFFNGVIQGERIVPASQGIKVIALMLAAAGVIVIRLAFKEYNLKKFLGLDKPSDEPFNSSGILSHIRHPLYAGTILIVAGFFFYDPRLATLISAGCIFIYLPIGIRLEENKLIAQFGDSYRQYKEEVPSIFPKIKNLF